MQCAMRPIDLQVFLLVCMNYRKVHSTENCDSNDCHVLDWLSWSVCVGNCGFQSHYRERHMCYDDEVRPHDLEHCLKHCNLDSNFELNVTQNCRIYENGGTLHILSCTCDVHHQGGCCQGKRRIYLCSSMLSKIRLIYLPSMVILTLYYFTNTKHSSLKLKISH